MFRKEFKVSILFFWLVGVIEMDSRFVRTNLPNRLFGFIPVGSNEEVMPLNQISNARVHRSVQGKPLALGVLISLLALGADGFMAKIIWLAVGILLILTSILIVVDIERSGGKFSVILPFFEKETAYEIRDGLLLGLSDSTDKTDLNMFFDKKDANQNTETATEVIVDEMVEEIDE